MALFSLLFDPDRNGPEHRTVLPQNHTVPASLFDALQLPSDTSIERLSGGEMNATFAIRGEHHESILRMSPQSFRWEQLCMKRAAQHGVSVAACEHIGEIGEQSFALQSRFPGIPGREWIGLAAEPREQSRRAAHVWREIGERTRAINAIPVAGIGFDIDNESQRDQHSMWCATVERSLQYLFRDSLLQDAGVVSDGQIVRARERLEALSDWRFTPHLTHRDATSRNVVVDHMENVHLVDWGMAGGWRAPHHEFTTFYAWRFGREHEAAFLEGYGMSPAEYADMRPELSILATQSLLETIRWAIEEKPGGIALPWVQFSQAILQEELR